MSVTSRSRRRGLGIIVALAALFVAAPAAQADVVYGGPPIPNKGTYLALGDSLAFGYQAVKVGACAPTGCANRAVGTTLAMMNPIDSTLNVAINIAIVNDSTGASRFTG